MSKLKQERLTSADLVVSVSQAPKIPDSTHNANGPHFSWRGKVFSRLVDHLGILFQEAVNVARQIIF